MLEHFNLASHLVDTHVASGRGPRPALRYQGRTLTYAEVATMVGRAGNALRSLGVDVEDRVAIVLPDSPELISVFMGAVKIGAVAVAMSDLFGPADYAYMLRDSRAKAVIAAASVVDRVAPRDSGSSRHVIVVGGDPSDLGPGRHSFEGLCAGASPDCTPEPTSRDDMAFWQYSSGSTGQAKGVVHLHQDMVHIAEGYGRHVIEIGPDDRVFSVAKLYFSYGCGNSLMQPFAVGASAILHPGRPDPATVFELVAREKPTLFFSVPTHYAALLASPALATADLSSVRRCVSAGEPLPASLFRRWKERFGLEILDGIGSTEVGHIYVSNASGHARAGTSGRVVAGYEVKVVDAGGAALPAGEVGELWVKGDSTAAYYWGKHELTKRAFRGEWFATSDRYVADAEGFLTYQGRADDMIRAGAMWVSPIEVEAALMEHPAVLEAAVVGRADDEDLVRVCAYVVLRDGTAADPVLSAALIEFARERVAHFKAPRWVEFVSELPKTVTGKIQRYKLRQ